MGDFLAAVPGAKGVLAHPAIVLCPWERRAPSKTQTFDDTILLDSQGGEWLPEMLARHCERRGAGDTVAMWSFDMEYLKSWFLRACQALGLPPGACLY